MALQEDGTGSSRSFWIATTDSPDGYPALDADLAVDVAVVGAGIVGITTATLLHATGRKVALLEAGRVARGVTGHTTAKVTSLHTLIYDELGRTFGDDAARLYGAANEAGLATIRQLCADHGIECELEETEAYTFAATEQDVESVEREVEAACGAGLPAGYVEETPVPFPTYGAVRFVGQAQFHPRKYLLPLVARLEADGAMVFERSRVVEIEAGRPSRLHTEAGPVVTADHVVVATHAPILDAKLLVARARAERSYALALEAGAEVPQGMSISASSPSHSVRVAPFEGRDVLIVSGEGHVVGEPGPGGARAHSTRLEEWARDQLGAGKVLFRWSTQDYASLDRLPFVGAIDGDARILAATGFGGWGMTTGTMAGMLLRDLVAEVDNPWAELFDPGRLKTAAIPSLVAKGFHDAKRLVGDRLRDDPGDALELARDDGEVVEIDGERLAVSRSDDGSLLAVSAVCTHLGCIVSWNDAERSWDCPCHGSRFSAAGEVLQGPATHPLADRSDMLAAAQASGDDD
jgi:glycine/D-amino acid oxidase-like deaminating enzyme/nitrite reductase/ring-hydroxylating ferredoxin subunit